MIGLFNTRDDQKNKYEYKVRWKGYDPSFDLWLTKDELYNCEEVLKNYLESELYKHFQKEVIANSRLDGTDTSKTN